MEWLLIIQPQIFLNVQKDWKYYESCSQQPSHRGRWKKKLVLSWSNWESGITVGGKRTRQINPVQPSFTTPANGATQPGTEGKEVPVCTTLQPLPTPRTPQKGEIGWRLLPPCWWGIQLIFKINMEQSHKILQVNGFASPLKVISSFLTWILSSLNTPSISKYVQNTGHSHSIFSKSLSSAGS